MPRVVLDTNVLVSALLFGGIPGEVLGLAIKGHIHPVTSSALVAELHNVLLSKFRFPPSVAELIITEWKALSLLVEPTLRLSVIPEDPSDNRVLECALTVHAEAIVSGDKHLLTLKVFRGIPILSPQAFLTRWGLTTR